MNSKKLKKCPFCGGEAEILAWGNVNVECKNCGSGSGVRDTEADAIAVWNKRATPNELRDREREIRIGTLLRLARYIQRNIKLWVGCDVFEDITSICICLDIGDRIFHKIEQTNRSEQKWRINTEIPALTFSGKEFLEALMDKSRKE